MRPDDKSEIARRFKELRQYASLTQLRLAALIGVGRQAVSDIENEKKLARYETWSRFAALEHRHLTARPVPSGPWE